MKTQKELFNDIKNLALKVDDLKGWVQNDFNRMIADGTVTKEDLKDSLEDILDDFDNKIDELNVLKLDVYNHIKLLYALR
jgi:CRISPR/Cas system CSM-associated protein Csm2 small subunit